MINFYRNEIVKNEAPAIFIEQPSYNDLQSSNSKRAKNYALLKLLLSLTKTIFSKNFRFLKVGFTCDQISARSPSQGMMGQKRSTLLTIC